MITGGMPLYDVRSPLAAALLAITGQSPPAFVRDAYSTADLTDPQKTELQDWCSLNANPAWSTGLGVLEAAELIVREAVINANISPQPTQGDDHA